MFHINFSEEKSKYHKCCLRFTYPNLFINLALISLSDFMLGWGFTSVVECWPTKHKALGSASALGGKKERKIVSV